MLQELSLQRVQIIAIGHAFDGLHCATFGFDAEHQAGTHEAPVEHDTASTAVTG